MLMLRLPPRRSATGEDEQAMRKAKTFLGLDVHVTKVRPARLAYEARPTGYVRAREAVRADFMRSRHRLSKPLLRLGGRV